jgi:hypothetical protein
VFDLYDAALERYDIALAAWRQRHEARPRSAMQPSRKSRRTLQADSQALQQNSQLDSPRSPKQNPLHPQDPPHPQDPHPKPRRSKAPRTPH